ncbi:MAG TPA: hypothetical protein VN229_00595 [Terriglobales bacterium]|nr:hypothetical protein [Terriglobales bacterium]
MSISAPASIVMIIGIFLFSCAIPLGIMIGRESIRSYRKDIVRDLQTLFKFAVTDANEPLIIPSFELVKYKYDPGPEQRSEETIRKEKAAYWLPAVIYACTSTLGMTALFWSTLPAKLDCLKPEAVYPAIPFECWPSVFLSAQFYFRADGFDAAAIMSFRQQVLCIAGFAFLGAYLFSISYLIRRVANFDLSPLSFFRSALHIFQGVCMAVVIFQAAQMFDIFQIQPGASVPSIQLLVAFVIGWFPNLGIEVVQSRFPSLQLKKVPPEAQQIAYELPITVIAGIDHFVRFRLTEFEIDDVQNLAAANPIQIFVETPYGLYQAIDWVAQAQLILAVGPEKVTELHKIDVRTIFDLEKALAAPHLRQRLAAILLRPLAQEDLAAIAERPSREVLEEVDAIFWRPVQGPERHMTFSSDPLTATICGIYDDLHVRRLRQICDVISDRLTERPRRSAAVFAPISPKTVPAQGVPGGVV